MENYYQRDKLIVTESITEEGIQHVLNCNRGYESRLIKKNEKDGYICRKLLRIENKNRKYNAFFLTEDGLDFAILLSKSLKIQLPFTYVQSNNNILIQKNIDDFSAIEK